MGFAWTKDRRIHGRACGNQDRRRSKNEGGACRGAQDEPMNQSSVRMLGVAAALSVASPTVATQPPQVSAPQSAQARPASSDQRAMRVPFGPGERLNFDVRLGTLK